MGIRRNWVRRVALPLLAVLAIASLAAACGSDDDDGDAGGASTTAAGKTSRGFDGKTVTVAGLGIKAQFPGSEIGARARIAKFNDTNELPGVKIEYAEFADDKQDPATALSEVRRLVTDKKVFALVGDVSQFNPGDYLKQQHVPYFGWAFDNSYCSDTGDESVYGFGYNGCLVPSNPKAMPDTYREFYGYLSDKIGKKNPTVASFSSDTTSGHNSTKFSSFQLEGVGFKVVYAKGAVPPPPVSDYTPYIQQLMTADGGKAPDAMVCLLAIDCIPIYKGVVEAGYKGAYYSNLYSDALLTAMKGSYANVTFVPFDTESAGLTEMKKYMEQIQAGYKPDTGAFSAWSSTDMFIQALKAAAKDGGISPENVHDKAMNQTWEIEGFAGPTKYPAALAHPVPTCGALTYDDGTMWKTIVPYSCSSKTWPIS